MNHIENLTEIQDLRAIAVDLAPLLRDDANDDIALQFPETVSRYDGGPALVTRHLLEDQGGCEPEVRQQFVAFSDGRAVGMGAVQDRLNVPVGVPSGYPNIWSFICHPYRGKGIGQLLLAKNLETVDAQFGGHAWTRVPKTDETSIQAVERAGLRRVAEEEAALIYVRRLVQRVSNPA
ncbi:MAG TPA: GNAT family N-acetyltransferase [Candidatus Saccharimonadales bacterium]|nr:GNAT family N-acetyltransferase [Candidatus Saccharimonadales bacterium]